ncbi:MAG TPA: SDR family NAD(P)-dependent oxidoreductase [Hyphomicrobiaceae bacterium]|nr:SDR family NAD(P)-dependent oxidoreductase [Hyphomicrobiaceae bacterium]
MSIRFDGRVAIVTGAGNGLGRSHALQLAARGAKVVINDLGGARDGSGSSLSAAEKVVEEIRAAGGEAMANGASVTDEKAVADMVDAALKAWGRVDILVNNAGILRDKSFGKMSLEDFHAVIEVHLMGGAICSHAVWNVMREQNYGRIVMTTSSSGLYGNFGQSNYAAAKMGLVGLMQTLSLEGAKNDIRVNCLAPTAMTRMTGDILPPAITDHFKPEFVTPAVLFLVSEKAPNRCIMTAGAGTFAVANVTMTQGLALGTGADTVEKIAARFDGLADRAGEIVPGSGVEQSQNELTKRGVKLG